MRIAVVNQHLDASVGGSELQCHLVAEGLAARGHDVVYIEVATGLPAGAEGGSRSSGVRRTYRSRPVARDASSIVAACVEERVEVVYWRLNRALLKGVVDGLERSGIPLVFAVAHIDDVSRWPVRPWGSSGPRARLSELRSRVTERRSWGAFAAVRAVASQRVDFLGRAPVAEQVAIRNLVPTDLTPFVWPRPYVAWVGSLQARKRPELLPAIASALETAGVDLLVAGELREPRFAGMFGPDAATTNLQHLGVLPLAEAAGLIAGARTLVVTAHEEGFANVLIQAWWYGTPTVSLDHDPDGMMSVDDLGVACGGAPGRLLDAVRSFATESEPAASERRSRIRATARARFEPQRTIDALEALLTRVASASVS